MYDPRVGDYVFVKATRPTGTLFFNPLMGDRVEILNKSADGTLCAVMLDNGEKGYLFTAELTKTPCAQLLEAANKRISK